MTLYHFSLDTASSLSARAVKHASNLLTKRDTPEWTDARTEYLQRVLCYIWIAAFAAFLAFHIYRVASAYIRRIACLHDDKQLLFAFPDSSPWTWVQRHILTAPLFYIRHSRAFRPASNLHFGGLPTRLESVIIFLYLGANVALCFYGITWDHPHLDPAMQFCDRTGIIATMNLVPVFLFAGRNNPLIWLLGVNYKYYVLMHRWVGRVVVLEALAHMLACMIPEVQKSGLQSFNQSISLADGTFLFSGMVGLCCFGAIFVLSPSVVRHAFYEIFLHVHQLLAIGALAAVWIHFQYFTDMRKWLVVAITLWVFERCYRLYCIFYRNVGHGRTKTKAHIEVLSGDAMRITIHLARPWKYEPGQYAFLYIPSISWWMSHPFSLAWDSTPLFTSMGSVRRKEQQASPHQDPMLPEKAVDQFESTLRPQTSVSLLVRRRGGFTSKLFERAFAKDGPLNLNAYLEGPYSGGPANSRLFSYGTVLLFATGVGVTHQLPYVRSLVAAHNLTMHTGRIAAVRKVVIVWVVRKAELIEWVRPWMTEVLRMEGRRDVLSVRVYVTQPGWTQSTREEKGLGKEVGQTVSTQEIRSQSGSVMLLPGRPDVGAVMDELMASAVGATHIGVCGTGGFGDDVRHAARKWMTKRIVDFSDSGFGW